MFPQQYQRVVSMEALDDESSKKRPASVARPSTGSKRERLTELGMLPATKRRRPSSSSERQQQQKSLQSHLMSSCVESLPRIVSFGPGGKQEGSAARKRNTSTSAYQKTKRTSSKKCLKRSVSFNPSEKKHEFDVSSEEKQNAWYARSDYRVFREEAQVTALSVRLGISGLMQPSEFCLRGLECSLSPREGNLRKLKRRLLIETIIEEQVSQKRINNGQVNSLVIGELSKVLSADAMQDAVKRASQDATSNS